jgi:hypothetical protein
MRPNPLLIQAIARTPTQFTHVFASRHVQSSMCPRAGPQVAWTARAALSALVSFHQLDAIAERIVDVHTMIALERLTFLERIS